MSNLANYSIESDQNILLIFRDGTQQRVSYQDLPKHLDKFDAARIKRAVAIRQQFFKDTVPKWLAVIVLAVGLLYAATGRQAARRFNLDSRGQQGFNGQSADTIPVPQPSLGVAGNPLVAPAAVVSPDIKAIQPAKDIHKDSKKNEAKKDKIKKNKDKEKDKDKD